MPQCFMAFANRKDSVRLLREKSFICLHIYVGLLEFTFFYKIIRIGTSKAKQTVQTQIQTGSTLFAIPCLHFGGINPLYTGRQLFHCYMLDNSMCHFYGCRVYFVTFIFFFDRKSS